MSRTAWRFAGACNIGGRARNIEANVRVALAHLDYIFLLYGIQGRRCRTRGFKGTPVIEERASTVAMRDVAVLPSISVVSPLMTRERRCRALGNKVGRERCTVKGEERSMKCTRYDHSGPLPRGGTLSSRVRLFCFDIPSLSAQLHALDRGEACPPADRSTRQDNSVRRHADS
jgi:hypothetical protein